MTDLVPGEKSEIIPNPVYRGSDLSRSPVYNDSDDLGRSVIKENCYFYLNDKYNLVYQLL